jgi:low temperature requirement protein LtrA
MKPRSPSEAHRAATPLELFFDLVIVVAVAQASTGLHHGLAEGHITAVVVTYGMVFFGVWWAWMNFTWFASAYDTDDIAYRLVVFVQMTGALILASGVEPMFSRQELTLSVVGYVVMRVASLAQWLRAAQADRSHRPAALRYAAGVALCQVAWVGLLFVPASLRVPGFFVLALAELLVPVWAERASPTPWHLHHIRERYGLFTLIVLGESVFSTALAVQSAIEGDGVNIGLFSIFVGALLIVYAIWWLYFYQPERELMTSLRTAFVWAYGHLFIFAATAAVGAGLAVSIDAASHHAELSTGEAGLAVALPASLLVLSLWILQEHPRTTWWFDRLLHPAAAILMLLTPLTEQPVLFTGILLAALVTIRLARHLE